MEFDQQSLQSWEANSNPKIVLKAKNKEELVKIAENAKEKGINYYLLEKPVTLKKKNEKKKKKAEDKKQEDAKNSSKGFNKKKPTEKTNDKPVM